MSAPLTDDELRTLRRQVETDMAEGRDRGTSAEFVLALLDEVEAHRVAPGDRYEGGDEHTERCRGLRCPCWLEGRGEPTPDVQIRAQGVSDEPVCDGSGRLAGNGVPPMGLSADWGACPGCSACHKNGGGGEAAVAAEAVRGDVPDVVSSEPVPASPAAVREQAAQALTEPLAAATGRGYESVQFAAAVCIDALAAAGLLRPEPWTTHDGEGRRWQVEPLASWELADCYEHDDDAPASLRPLPTEEA